MKRLKLFLGLVAALFMAVTGSVDAQTFTTSTAPDPSATTWASGTTWYKMKIDGGKYITLSQTGDHGSLRLSATSAENTDMRALWCVTGNETDGYQFYNMAAGPSAVLGMTGTEDKARARMYSKAKLEEIDVAPITVFDRKTPANKTYEDFVYHGTNNNTWNQRDGFLATWNSTLAIGDGCTGSQVIFEAVDLSDVSINYATNYTNVLNAVKGYYSAGDTYRFENYATHSSFNSPLIPASVSNETEYYGAMFMIQLFNTSIFGIYHKSLDNNQITLASSDTKYPVADNASSTVLATSDLTKECVWTLKATGDGHYYLYNRPTHKYLNTTSGTDGATPVALNTTPRAYFLECQSDGTIKLLDEGYAGNRYLRINGDKLVRGSFDIATKFNKADASEELQTKVVNATISYNPQDGKGTFTKTVELQEGDDVLTYIPSFDFYTNVSASPATVNVNVTEYSVTCTTTLPTTEYGLLKVNNNKLVYKNEANETRTDGYFSASFLKDKGGCFKISRVAGSELVTIQRMSDNYYLTASNANNQTLGTWGADITEWTEGTGATSYFRLTTNGDGFNIQHPGNAQANMGNHVNGKLGFWTNANSSTNDGSRIYIKDIAAEAKSFLATAASDTYVGLTTSLSSEIDALGTITATNAANLAEIMSINHIVNSNKYYQILSLREVNDSYPVVSNVSAYADANGVVSEEALSRKVQVRDGTNEFSNSEYIASLWQFETGDDNTTYITNANTGFYLANVDGGQLVTTKTKTYGKNYLFIPGPSGKWCLKDTGISGQNCYLNSFYSESNKPARNIGYWTNSIYDDGNLFYIKEVTSIPVTISAVGYATLNLPMAVEKAPGVKAYYGAKDNASTISLAEISGDVIPANTPVILVAENTLSEATQFNFNISYDNPGTSPVSNALTGTTCKRKMNVGAPVYVLKNGNSGIGFYRVDSTTDLTLNANKAYYGNATGGASVVRFDFGSTTGIDNTQILNTDDAKLYDLNGRRVLYPTTGVYVKSNGEKVFVK